MLQALPIRVVKEDFQFGHRCAPGTHQPFLFHVCNRPNLRVLEFGCGYFSTPLLNILARKLHHRLISMESDMEWINKAQQRCVEIDHHEFWVVPDWFTWLEEDPAGLQQVQWDVIFIDQAPWDARKVTLEKFKNIAEYIVIHDSNMHPGYEIDYDQYLKHYETYMPPKNAGGEYPYKTGPPTLIGSNFNECKFEIDPTEFDQ